MQQEKTRIDSIQALRGVAALLVILYHYRLNLNGIYQKANFGDSLFGNGALGVDLFFIISGFVMGYVTTATTTPGAFLLKRFFRIIPLATVATVGTFMLGGNELPTLLKSLLFIPLKNSDAPFYGYSLLSPVWTLSYEVIFYGVFALALAISPKRRIALASAGLAAMVFGMQILLGHLTIDPLSSPLIHWDSIFASVLSEVANPLFLEFIAGMAIARFYLSNVKIPKSWINLFFIATLGYFLFTYALRANLAHGLSGYGHVCALLVLGVVLFEKHGQRFIVPAWLMKLGDLSYSMYLAHIFVMIVVDRLNDLSPQIKATVGISRVALMLALTLALAWLLFSVVEKPFILIGKMLLKYWNERVMQVVTQRSSPN